MSFNDVKREYRQQGQSDMAEGLNNAAVALMQKTPGWGIDYLHVLAEIGRAAGFDFWEDEDEDEDED